MNKHLRRSLLALLCSLVASGLISQQQNLKGIITDRDSNIPLIGATVIVDTTANIGTTTDVNGEYKIKVDVGQAYVIVSYLGYESQLIQNIDIRAGKEAVINIALAESNTELAEVVVRATDEGNRVLNSMATLSTKAISMSQSRRFSGGRNDISRLVSNYAGVTNIDDTRNDIVVRGNSPTGIQYRLEGIPIPNPNHFSTLGTTGGPTSLLNPNVLSQSDFSLSAFPANYGNALSGIFDLNFRNGNKEKFEFLTQFSAFTGLEFMGEGPFLFKGSSFLFSYRRAYTVFATEIANQLNLTNSYNATPNYQDLSFKFDSGTGKLGRIEIFGMVGDSDVAILASETKETDLFGEIDSDFDATSTYEIYGLKYSKIINNQSYLNIGLLRSKTFSFFQEYKYFTDQLQDNFRFNEGDDEVVEYVVTGEYNIKHSASLTSNLGFIYTISDYYSYVEDRSFNEDLDNDGLPDIDVVRDIDRGVNRAQFYVQSKAKINELLTVTGGLHVHTSSNRDKLSLEPRLAASYRTSDRSQMALGYGLHSQELPLPILFYTNEDYELVNLQLDFQKAHHVVLSFSQELSRALTLKTELYYQQLFNIPVSEDVPTYSALNSGAEFFFDPPGKLLGTGTGSNYGVDIALERVLKNGLYYSINTSIFSSNYQGFDQVKRSTAFNSGFNATILAGKELKIGARNKLQFDLRMVMMSGNYRIPIDLARSQQLMFEVRDFTDPFSLKLPNYIRVDCKIGGLFNAKKFSHEYYFDFQNVFNRRNIHRYKYSTISADIIEVRQSGFIPDIFVRVLF